MDHEPKEERQTVPVVRESKLAVHVIVILGVSLVCLIVILSALVFKQQKLKKLSLQHQQSARAPAVNPVYGHYYYNDDPEPLPRDTIITDSNPLYNTAVEERPAENSANGNIYASLMHPPTHPQ